MSHPSFLGLSKKRSLRFVGKGGRTLLATGAMVKQIGPLSCKAKS